MMVNASVNHCPTWGQESPHSFFTRPMMGAAMTLLTSCSVPAYAKPCFLVMICQIRELRSKVMKAAILILSLALPCGFLNANTFGFLPGDKPELSMKSALEILEKHAKSVTGREFIPRYVSVMGNGKPGGGVWDIRQHDKDGKVFRFMVYFPEDQCLILDEKDGMKPLGAFTRKGKPIDMKKAGMLAVEETDPFAEPEVPEEEKK